VELLLPLEFQSLNAPFPGNFKVNVPSPLEIPRLMHSLPWKFQGSSTGGVRIIIGIVLAMYEPVFCCKQCHFNNNINNTEHLQNTDPPF
jgi:hypothetical protein